VEEVTLEDPTFSPRTTLSLEEAHRELLLVELPVLKSQVNGDLINIYIVVLFQCYIYILVIYGCSRDAIHDGGGVPPRSSWGWGRGQ